MNAAPFKLVERVACAEHLISDIFDFGFAQKEAIVCLEVNEVIIIESVARGLIIIVHIGSHVCARTYGDMVLPCAVAVNALNYVAHEVERAPVNAEFVSRYIHGVFCSIGIVVMRRYGKAEVPDSFRVLAVYLNAKHVVLALVCNLAG